jgi:lipopolysaccharide/colanic/teichoic acid biosynthesis glycosyltransferase
MTLSHGDAIIIYMRQIRERQLLGRVHDDRASRQIGPVLDAIIAAILLAVTAPLILFIALAISAESSGPILVSETCIGLGGRRFQMLKFRTTLHDPDQTMPVWARNTTKIGQFVRWTRIETLPQLINVLRGEMSILDLDGRSPSFLD